MPFLDWLFRKKSVTQLEGEVKKSFANVKKDFHKVTKWISHFDEKHKGHEEDISLVLERLDKMEKDVDEIKNFVEFFIAQAPKGFNQVSKQGLSKQQFKQAQTGVQTGAVQTAVQIPVQTAVQTPLLKKLTVMERAVLIVLLNSNEKLSYDDISILSGKDRSTVRGQINNIKRKSEEIISEIVESDGKKRFFVEENLKERILDDIIRGRRAKKEEKIEIKSIRKRRK